MPPSPALRYSPRREHRAENHKRGRSFEGTAVFREKDDDLALFNEMQSKERESFLLQSSDDLEDTFSTKLRQFSDFKLGISIPARGESSELLNVEAEKNDYDWLLTPPDTPLFPSLDDEPQPVNVSSRGRPRSQPIAISRQSTMEKSYRSSRGSASPNRLSPSPRSGNSSLQSRGRPSSTPHSSPPRGHRTATPPPRRPSPPPSKPSTPAPRSSTPTPGRTSAGSGARGMSPVRTNRGHSASPKVRSWQSNIPGFSSEAPPNLRTSLTDRPATYVRGSSPASRNGRESGYRYGRQSMSPTASRSVSSSHSQDRDRVSSNSRGSVASSGDDDIDSLQSIHVGSLDSCASKKTGVLSSNRVPALSKKSTRILSPSSAPKRSFDSALRQMDHRKSPQNMFRPLLSSVPTSSFYVGKATSVQRPLMYKNSPVTTSSNASSDQGNEDMAVESRKTTNTDSHVEVFSFDKEDMLNKEFKHDTDDGSVHFQAEDFDGTHATEHEPNNSEEFVQLAVDMETSSASESLRADFSEADSHENTHVCVECGCRYRATKTVENDVNLCPDCGRQHSLMAAIDSDKAEISQQEDSVKPSQTSLHEHNDSRTFSEESSLSRVINGIAQAPPSHRRSGSDSVGHSSVHSNDFRILKMDMDMDMSSDMDISDGAGISVLLKRSRSSKGPVVQSRTFVASSIPYDDFSYIRDSANSLRSSVGHGSISASSSIDLSSSRQLESRVQRQFSGKNMENYRFDASTRPQSTGSSSNHNHHENSENGVEKATHAQVAAFENDDSDASFADITEQNSGLSCNPGGIQPEENSVASVQNSEHCLSHESEDVLNNASSVFDVSTSVIPTNAPLNSNIDGQNDAGVPPHSSLASISEIETANCCQSTLSSETEEVLVDSKGTTNEIQDSSIPTQSDKGTCSAMERMNSVHLHGILAEDSTVTMLEEGSKSRSLTLEEATDTILFCSSIVHDLAYQAATIAIEKEDSITPLENSRPTVTILGKSTPERNRTPVKRPSKSQKVKQKHVDLDVKSPSIRKTENDENANESTVRNVGVPNHTDSTKPQKLESKCNCAIM